MDYDKSKEYQIYLHRFYYENIYLIIAAGVETPVLNIKNRAPSPATEPDVHHVVPVSFPVAGLRILFFNLGFYLAGLPQLVLFDRWLEPAEFRVAGFFYPR